MKGPTCLGRNWAKRYPDKEADVKVKYGSHADFDQTPTRFLFAIAKTSPCYLRKLKSLLAADRIIYIQFFLRFRVRSKWNLTKIKNNLPNQTFRNPPKWFPLTNRTMLRSALTSCGRPRIKSIKFKLTAPLEKCVFFMICRNYVICFRFQNG